jgi:hypothetical protein
MSLAYDIKKSESSVTDPALDYDNEDKEVFSKAISKLIEEKFNFSTSEVSLERKPKADKGV